MKIITFVYFKLLHCLLHSCFTTDINRDINIYPILVFLWELFAFKGSHYTKSHAMGQLHTCSASQWALKNNKHENCSFYSYLLIDDFYLT